MLTRLESRFGGEKQEMQDKRLLLLLYTILGSRVILRKDMELHWISRSVHSKRIGAIARKDWETREENSCE